MGSLLCALCLAPLIFSGCAKREVTLEDLTVPTDALPAGCELAPGVGLPFSPPKPANPMMTTDPNEIRLLIIFVLGLDGSIEILPVSEENSAVKNQKIIQEWAAKQATKVEAAYLASYKDRSPDGCMVWALQFKDPKEAKSHFERLSNINGLVKSKHYFIKGSILAVAWTDSVSDLSCFDTIREYLEKD